MYPIQEVFKDLQGSKQEIINNLQSIEINKPILFVAMTARTGSTAFCSLLANDQRIGLCDELFNPRGPVQTKITQSGMKNPLFTDYISYLHDTVVSNYFTFKISWQDYEFFTKNNIDKLLFNNSKYIFLDRFDIESQAVSLYYSLETDVWHSNQVNYKNEKQNSVKFDKEKLDLITLSLIKEKKSWWNYFYKNQINPMVMHYEDFTTNFNFAYKNILNSVNLTQVKDIDWNQATLIKFHNKSKLELVTHLRESRYGKLF